MLKNLVTLVTGGASGLGRATVDRLAKVGSRVVICDLPQSNGEEIAKKVGENVSFIPADVRSESDVQNLMNKIQTEYGKLNMVVNCATIARYGETYNYQSSKPVELEHFELVFGTRVLGTLNINRLAIDLLKKNEPDANGFRGTIINTTASETITFAFGDVMNAASSAAINGMTYPLAECLADAGIRVVTIAHGLMANTSQTDTQNFSESMRETIVEDVISLPKRFGEPDEFAHLVQMVGINPSITGTTIDIHGGLK